MGAVETVAAQQCGQLGGLDAVDMDMIRRGDMLGPELGERAVSLIQSQAAEIAADKARIAELEAALKPFARIAEAEDFAGTKDGGSILVNVNLCRIARALGRKA